MLEQKSITFIRHKDQLKVGDKTASSTAPLVTSTSALPELTAMPGEDFSSNSLNPSNLLSCLLEEYHFEGIPGLGTPYEDCGKFLKIWECQKCNYSKPIPKRCFRASCPECWKSWAQKKTNYAVQRLLKYPKQAKKVKGRYVGELADVMLSPPQEYAKVLLSEPDGKKKLRKEAIKLLRAQGMDGELIFHLWRVRPHIIEKLRAISSGNGGSHFWQLIRENALNLHKFEDYVYVSPHYHTLGYLRKFTKGDEIYEKSGWVWKTQYIKPQVADNAEKARLEGKEIESVGELLSKKIFYFLSHAVIEKGKSPVTWFGKLSYNQMHVVSRKILETSALCPVCGTPLLEIEVGSGGTHPALDVTEVWEFSINHPQPKQLKFGENGKW